MTPTRQEFIRASPKPGGGLGRDASCASTPSQGSLVALLPLDITQSTQRKPAALASNMERSEGASDETSLLVNLGEGPHPPQDLETLLDGQK